MVFSPLSIHVVLSLIAAGTKGPTLEQLLSFLKAESIDQLNSLASDIVPRVFADTGGPCLSFANSLWVDKSLPFKPSFKHVVDSFYKAACNQADFKNKAEEARIEVNSWAEKETKGLITEVLPQGSVGELTALVLANALYFKGVWEEEFDASKTKVYDFHRLDASPSVKAPFMTSGKAQSICAFDGFKVLRLPYKGRDNNSNNVRFSMCLFLPDKNDGLSALVERVCSGPGFIENHIPNSFIKVPVGDLRIPKFEITSGFDASKTLQELGLVLPFEVDPNKGGNITEMVYSPPGKDPYVQSIFHKSFIKVDERGTEAAAVTAAILAPGCARFPKMIDFVADHPFLFLIREENTGAVLFVGQVLNPLEGGS